MPKYTVDITPHGTDYGKGHQIEIANVEAVTPEPRVLVRNESGTMDHITQAVAAAIAKHASDPWGVLGHQPAELTRKRVKMQSDAALLLERAAALLRANQRLLVAQHYTEQALELCQKLNKGVTK